MCIHFIRWLNAVVCCAAAALAFAQARRSVEISSAAESSLPSRFDAAQSAALFVGIREFTHDRELASVPYAVDDAVDLAYAMVADRPDPLVRASRVALALSGEPQKAVSRQRLAQLRAAGASVHPAGQTDIIALLERQSRSAGKDGVLVVSFATHGFSAEGEHYLVASSSLLQHRETALSLSKIFDIASTSEARRSLVFLDACRRRMRLGSRSGEDDGASAAPLIDAMASSHGHAVFHAAAPGQYAYDDEERGNGVFTAAVIDGLRCAAKSDARGLITVDTLADYVNGRVLAWVRKHRDRKVTTGIQVTMDSGGKLLPVAVCGVPGKGTSAEQGYVVTQLGHLVERTPALADHDAALVRVDDGVFHVLNAAGVRLWGGAVDGKIIRAELVDLDADGRKEVVAGVGGAGADVGKIFVFEAGGGTRWSRDTAAAFNYESARSGRMSVMTFVTGDLLRSGKRQIVALSLDAQGWFPSRLSVFERDGTLLSSYWHPGHLHHVVIGAATADADPRIVVGGVNNDLRAPLGVSRHVPTVFALDPKRISGEAPPYLGRAGVGTELWYAVILPEDAIERLEIVDMNQDGINEISAWSGSNNVFYVSFEGRLLSLGRGDGAKAGAQFLLVQKKK